MTPYQIFVLPLSYKDNIHVLPTEKIAIKYMDRVLSNFINELISFQPSHANSITALRPQFIMNNC